MLKKIHDNLYELPQEGEMLVPARIYGNKNIIDHLLADIEAGKEWNALRQLENVAALPGIQKYALAMSDVHPGYGFPIGGVGAFDLETGVVSVAGVGFDINCGVRTLITPLLRSELTQEKKEKLANQFFLDVPAGVGSEGKIKLTLKEIDEVLVKGAQFIIERGYGFGEDLEYIEENGCVREARPENVSLIAKQRQFKQIGTLGSGNHYLEVQYVEKIFLPRAAQVFGLTENQILVSIHCGSRGLGHQIGSDYLKILEKASIKYNIPIRERELVSAPFKSPEGVKYFTATNCGINCAFANRQAISHLVRLSLKKILGVSPEEIKTLYEVGHNNLKIETHEINGEKKKLVVHRKGSTRAFGPGREEIPLAYREIGQPVLVGGTMGTHSYILHGTERGMAETFGSACHGAGRQMSRIQAKRKWQGKTLIQELFQKGIIIKGHSLSGIAEEAPGSYKDVDEVVEVMDQAEVAKKVARLKPLICIKG